MAVGKSHGQATLGVGQSVLASIVPREKGQQASKLSGVGSLEAMQIPPSGPRIQGCWHFLLKQWELQVGQETTCLGENPQG